MVDVIDTSSLRSLSASQRFGIEFLSGHTVTAELDARLLLQAASGLRHEEIISNRDLAVSKRCQQLFQSYLRRRVAGEPVHRIVGFREFFGRNFNVSEHTLLPRPETELLVEMVLVHSKGLSRESGILDIGTGSGVIAISLALEGGFTNVIATDVSCAAINVAQSNAKLLGAVDCIEFREENVLTGVSGKHDVIVSNPPYIPKHEIESLDIEVRNFDPHCALDGGCDGLDFYRAIFSLGDNLSPDGKIFTEIGYGQAQAVSEICDSSGFQVEDIKKDLSGIDRVLVARKKLADG